MPEPPFGYRASKIPMLLNGKLVGFQIVLLDDDSIDKIIMQVELGDTSTHAARLASAKGYVDGFRMSFLDAGLKATSATTIDWDQADFESPVIVDTTFSSDGGRRIWIRNRILFSERGYNLSLMATSEEEFRRLADWIEEVRPAPAPVKSDAPVPSQPR